MSDRIKEYERIAKIEIPIYTKVRPGPEGKVDCLRTKLDKQNKRKILIAALILKERNAGY